MAMATMDATPNRSADLGEPWRLLDLSDADPYLNIAI